MSLAIPGLRMRLGAKRGSGLAGAALTISQINALITAAGGGDFFLADPVAGNYQDSAGTTTPAVAVNDPIGYLRNLAPSARHMTQGTSGAKPLLKQDGSSFWYAEFDGVDDVLSNSSPWMYAAGACTIIMVANVNAGFDRRIIASGSTSSTSSIYAPIQTNTATPSTSAAFIRNSANSILMNSNAAIRASTFGAKSVIIAKDDGSNIYHAVDNLTFTSAAYTRSGTMAVDVYAIGALIRTTTGSYAAMNLYGVIIVTGALSDANIQAIANKLVSITGGTTI